MAYERVIVVTCGECKAEFDERGIKEMIDISEDARGQDVLTFVCPKCKQLTTSLRRG